MALLACGGGGGGSSPTQDPPAISSLEATHALGPDGYETTLTASFTGGTGAVDQGVGAVTSGLPARIRPLADTTYTLTVTGGGQTRTFSRDVVAPPRITAFTAAAATLPAGSRATLTPSFAEGTGTVEPGALAAVSGVPILTGPLDASTTFTLTVTKGALRVTRPLEITVTLAPNAPAIASFTTETTAVVPGATYRQTLTPVFSNGTGSVEPGIGAVQSGVPIEVHPQEDTTYVLTVAGQGPARTASARVVAVPAIRAFQAAQSPVGQGLATSLTALFTGGTGVVDGLGPIASGVPFATPALNSDRTFRLTVTNAAGQYLTRDLLVPVSPAPAPQITAFTVTRTPSPNLDQPYTVTLAATFTGGTGAVDQGVGQVQSGVPVAVTDLLDDKDYTLTVTGPTGTAFQVLHAVAPPSIQSFVPEASRIARGATVRATATFKGATAAVNGVAVTSGALQDFGTPQATTSYMLLVRNSVGEGIRRTITVTVTEGVFVPAGTLQIPRSYHTSTLLPDGRVLLAGGNNTTATRGTYLDTAELYDPADDSFTLLPATLGTGRGSHTATPLVNGQVLLAGGASIYVGYPALSSLERFDPATGAFVPTGGNLVTPRGFHTDTRLQDGTVLLAGGLGTGDLVLHQAEIYDPVTDLCTPAGSMAQARQGHTATLLPDGKVLVAGGIGSSSSLGPALATAELYDPATRTFTAAGSMTTARRHHTATLLGDGRVLVAGGTDVSALQSVEIYDPSANTFTYYPQALVKARFRHTATLLPNGKVLLAGGRFTDYGLAEAELFNPGALASGSPSLAAEPMNRGRYGHAATLLGNGKVLVTGGGLFFDFLDSAERYEQYQ